jgi:tyrosine aminotransferase
MSESAGCGVIEASAAAQRTANPIRGIVDRIAPDPAHRKSFLKLSIGDPTLDGNLLPPSVAEAAVIDAVRSRKYNGYAPSHGLPEARRAVAAFWSDNFARDRPGGRRYEADDAVVCSGASQALEIAIAALCNPGDALLLPAPGFSIYEVVCANRGIAAAHYACLPERQWDIDLDALDKTVVALRAAGKRVPAIVVNNPANPSGSNFSREHVRDICAFAGRHRLVIIADEIYAGMTFGGRPFTSVASFSTAPALIIGGIAKIFVVPGWRLGWIVRHDDKCASAATPGDSARAAAAGAPSASAPLDRVWAGVIALTQIIIGPNALVQAALPAMLSSETAAERGELVRTINAQHDLCLELLQAAAGSGLKPVPAGGAMYMLVGIDVARFDARHGITDDVAFAAALMREENVQVLPGSIFHAPGFFRIVVTKPPEQLREAVGRIVAFAQRSAVASVAA